MAATVRVVIVGFPLLGSPHGKTAFGFSLNLKTLYTNCFKEYFRQYLKNISRDLDVEDVGVKFVVVLFRWPRFNHKKTHKTDQTQLFEYHQQYPTLTLNKCSEIVKVFKWSSTQNITEHNLFENYCFMFVQTPFSKSRHFEKHCFMFFYSTSNIVEATLSNYLLFVSTCWACFC